MIADRVARHAWNPLSYCLNYADGWQWANDAVPYLEAHRTAIVWGDPLCDEPDLPAALDDALRALRARRLRVCLVVVGRTTAELAAQRGCSVLKIGEQPRFDLTTWEPPRGDPGKHLRWCLNKAAQAGVETRPYASSDLAEAQAAIAAWEAALGRPPSTSWLRTAPFERVDDKRLFVATRAGRIEALLACTPIPARRGWFIEDMIHRPDAPVGASELAVVATLRHLAESGAETAWLDVAPLRHVDEQLQRRATALFTAGRPVVAYFGRRYPFRDLSRYLAKFVPTAWEERYVAFQPRVPTPGVVRALMDTI